MVVLACLPAEAIRSALNADEGYDQWPFRAVRHNIENRRADAVILHPKRIAGGVMSDFRP